MTAHKSSAGLARAAASTFGGVIVGAVATLVLTRVVGHGLGAGGTGLFFQAIGLFAIASNALQLGADTALVRTLSQRSALGETAALRPTVRIAVVPVLLVGAVFALVTLLAAPALAPLVSPADPAYAEQVIRILSPFVGVGALLAVLLGGTRGTGGTLPYTVLQNLGLPIARLVVVAASVWAGLGVQWIVGAWAAPLVVAAAAAAVVLRRALRRAHPGDERIEPAARHEIRATFWRFAGPRGVSALLERAIDWSGVLIVIAMAGPVQGGIYAVVNRCASTGYMIDQAARIVTGPRISRALAQGDTAHASDLFVTVTRWIVLVSWPFYLSMAVFAPTILSIFGAAFPAGAPALTLVTLAMMLSTTTGMVQSILLMGGRSSWQMANRGIQLATLIVLTIVLVPMFGLVGAAIGWLASILVDTVLATVQVAVRMRIHSSPRLVVLPATLALVVFGGGGLLLSSALGQQLSTLLLGGGGLAIVYALLCLVLRDRLGLSFLRFGRRRSAPSEDGTAAGQRSVLLVASTGGHLAQLLTLDAWWRTERRTWVTFKKPDAEAALADEAVIWAYHPVTRNIPNAIRNLGLAIRTLRTLRPDVVVSTGAGVSLPFFVVARFLRIRTVFIEVLDRIDSATMTGRLSYPISDVMCGQWPEQRAIYPESVVIGPTL